MTNYSDYSKEELISLIRTLDSRLKKRCGINWDSEKVPENVVISSKYKIPILNEMTKKSISKNSGDDNILIVGENYYSLECLSYTHKGGFDVIYIDPPYNTLKEGFMYNDKKINSEDAYRHSSWLNFMEKRLKIAERLLSDNGFIAISIDDNEFAQLKLLCDQIFKEDNLLDVFHIQVRYLDKHLNEKDHFQKVMEYCLLYAKDKKNFVPNKPFEEYSLDNFNLVIKELKKGKKINIDNRKVTVFKKGQWSITKKKKGKIGNLKETWVSGAIYSKTGHGKIYQEVVEPRIDIDGYGCLYKIEGIGEDGLGYRYFSGPQQKNAKKGKMYTGVPLDRVDDIKKNGYSIKYSPIVNFYDYSADFGNIKNEGGVNFPNGKKPVKMLKQIINMHTNKNARVLDFFAGSGSTGHAVLDLNVEDKGNRTFVLCTNNEVKPQLIIDYCKKNNITEKEFYNLLNDKNAKVLKFTEKNGLFNLFTYPRLKNVICGYKTEKGKNIKGFSSNLKVYEIDKIDVQDIIEITDNDRKKITERANELIAIKENTFINVESNSWYTIMSNRKMNKYTAIYYVENLKKFDELLKKIEDKITSLYIYSSGILDKETYSYLPNNIIVKDIPQPILDMYQQIYKRTKR